ncbi:MAG: hypothetical protein U0231_14560 [Nitrospiraceae bacterium]
MIVLRQLRARQFDCGRAYSTDGDRPATPLSLVTGAPVRVGFNGEHRWRGLLTAPLRNLGRQIPTASSTISVR